jgi:hypothetical protein
VLTYLQKLHEDTVWTILSRRCNISILYTLYKGCATTYSQSLFPYHAFEKLDLELHEAGHRQGAAEKLSSEALDSFKWDPSKAAMSWNCDEERLFVAAIMEWWLCVEVNDWTRSCSYAEVTELRLLLDDLVRLPSVRASNHAVMDLVHQLEAHDFLYLYLGGHCSPYSLKTRISRWKSGLESDPDIVTTRDLVVTWQIEKGRYLSELLPVEILGVVASYLSSEAAWNPHDVSVTALQRVYSRRDRWKYQIEHMDQNSPDDIMFFEDSFQVQVQSLVNRTPDIGLTIHTAGHFRENWRSVAQGTVFEWGKSEQDVLHRLREYSSTIDDSKTSYKFITSTEFMTARENIAVVEALEAEQQAQRLLGQ